MVELFEIFWSAKIELRVVILATLIMGCVWYWQDHKRKQKERENGEETSIKKKKKFTGKISNQHIRHFQFYFILFIISFPF